MVLINLLIFLDLRLRIKYKKIYISPNYIISNHIYNLNGYFPPLTTTNNWIKYKLTHMQQAQLYFCKEIQSFFLVILLSI